MLSFWQVIILKAVYTAVITVLVIKWIVLRLIVYYAEPGKDGSEAVMK